MRHLRPVAMVVISAQLSFIAAHTARFEQHMWMTFATVAASQRHNDEICVVGEDRTAAVSLLNSLFIANVP